jgi:alpha-ketoglutarate-dependent taurine dioxygenase
MTTSSLPSTSPFTINVEPGKPPVLQTETADDAQRWVADRREALRQAVTDHGALLVRGLRLNDADHAGAVFRQLGALMTETEAFAPRLRYAQGLYSTSKWPPRQPMCVHHELSYALEFPSLMLFACLTPPASGGATPLADSPSVLRALPATLVDRFERAGWLLVRNYNNDIGASLAESFGTGDHGAIERYCRANAIDFEWLPGGGLRTRQYREAVFTHPRTGQKCWFNQVAFLNAWTMDAEVREYLIEVYGEDALPFDTRFGDGSMIGPEIVQTINEAYEAHTVREAWQAGDLLLVDNIRTAHGREPFTGPREVVVGMMDAVRGKPRSTAIVAA